MALKTRIKQAISDNSNFKALKVWGIEKSDNPMQDTETWWIEVEVKKKVKSKSKK